MIVYVYKIMYASFKHAVERSFDSILMKFKLVDVIKEYDLIVLEVNRIQKLLLRKDLWTNSIYTYTKYHEVQSNAPIIAGKTHR